VQQLAALEALAPFARDLGGQAVELKRLRLPEGAAGEDGLGLPREHGVGDLVEAKRVVGDARHVGQLAPPRLRRRHLERAPGEVARHPGAEPDGPRERAPAHVIGVGEPPAGPQGTGDVDVARVAAEQLVPARPGEGDGHPGLPGCPAHEVGVDPVEGGLIDGREGVGELLLEGLLREHDVRVAALEDFGHLPGVAALVIGGQVEADGEGVHGAGRDLARERRHRARIDAAGEEDAEGHVGDELHLDGTLELLPQLGHRGAAVRRRRQAPVPAQTPRVLLASPVAPFEREDAGGGQEADALDDGIRAHHEAVPEIGGHGGGRKAARHGAAREERAHLGGEQHRLLAGALVPDHGPVQGLDAHRVAHEVDGAGPGIPQGQGEDATEALDAIDAPSPVGRENDLGVARGPEGLTQGLEIAADLLEVVDLAIERDGAPGPRVDHGLGPGFAQVDDGEPAVSEDDFLTAGVPQARPIGPAVPHGRAHPVDEARDPLATRPRRCFARRDPADCAGNSTHYPSAR
jgi:hypothetical protein